MSAKKWCVFDPEERAIRVGPGEEWEHVVRLEELRTPRDVLSWLVKLHAQEWCTRTLCGDALAALEEAHARINGRRYAFYLWILLLDNLWTHK